MRFIPWRYIADWKCSLCGDCCRLYSVVLNFPEWLRIAKTFGAEKTVAGMDRFYIKRASDGSCPFLCNLAGAYLCGLQNMKPDACKLWPFKVFAEPRYGEEKFALYGYGEKRFFVYADSMCSGFRYGAPTWEFASIVKEFVELALRTRNVQHKTTSSLPAQQPSYRRHWINFY